MVSSGRAFSLFSKVGPSERAKRNLVVEPFGWFEIASFLFKVQTLVKGYIRLSQNFTDTKTAFDIVILACRVTRHKRPKNYNSLQFELQADKFTENLLKRKFGWTFVFPKTPSSTRLSSFTIPVFALGYINPVQWLLWDRIKEPMKKEGLDFRTAVSIPVAVHFYSTRHDELDTLNRCLVESGRH